MGQEFNFKLLGGLTTGQTFALLTGGLNGLVEFVQSDEDPADARALHSELLTNELDINNELLSTRIEETITKKIEKFSDKMNENLAKIEEQLTTTLALLDEKVVENRRQGQSSHEVSSDILKVVRDRMPISPADKTKDKGNTKPSAPKLPSPPRVDVPRIPVPGVNNFLFAPIVPIIPHIEVYKDNREHLRLPESPDGSDTEDDGKIPLPATIGPAKSSDDLETHFRNDFLKYPESYVNSGMASKSEADLLLKHFLVDKGLRHMEIASGLNLVPVSGYATNPEAKALRALLDNSRAIFAGLPSKVEKPPLRLVTVGYQAKVDSVHPMKDFETYALTHRGYALLFMGTRLIDSTWLRTHSTLDLD